MKILKRKITILKIKLFFEWVEIKMTEEESVKIPKIMNREKKILENK